MITEETELRRSPLNMSEEAFLDGPLDAATAINDDNDEYSDDDPLSSDEDDADDESYSPNTHPWTSSHQQPCGKGNQWQIQCQLLKIPTNQNHITRHFVIIRHDTTETTTYCYRFIQY